MSLDPRGITAEDFIIQHVKIDGEWFEKATYEDNYRKDVDAYHFTLGRVSIKSQSDKYSNIALEVRQHDSRDTYNYIHGWFEYGEADTYLFALRDDQNGGKIHTIHLIDKWKLKRWVENQRLRDTYCHHAKKLNKGRQYDLPVVKLASINDLLRDRIIFKTIIGDFK